MVLAVPRAPDLRLLALEVPRAGLTLVRLAQQWSKLLRQARGDGRPVMLLPGLLNTESSNVVMQRYLAELGYAVQGWGLGRNLGTRTIGAEGERLIEAIAAMAEESGEPVTVIGVSLGGIMARWAAHQAPELVREVITVSSPYAGHPRATNVWKLFEWASGERVDDADVQARLAQAAEPLPVPSTAIWSASDGLVAGGICCVPGEPGCRAIEVTSSHLAVSGNPEVLRVIAKTLARSAQRSGRAPS